MKISAGLLLYRGAPDRLEVLVVHPGGPYFARRQEGVWSIPKGLVDPQENLLEAAKREFEEETGIQPEGDEFLDLGEIRQKGGKVVHAWAFAGDCDPEAIESNPFSIEWPPGSGKKREFPEIDAARFADLDEARRLLLPAQYPFLDRLEETLRGWG